MKQRVLVVEDEPAIADTIVYALATEGFDPVWCATGQAALDAVRAAPAALAILDVGLPDINGFELFKKLQLAGDLPAIFLTARSSEIDRVVGLELGADDYVAKPFSPRELVARVRTVLRRVGRSPVVADTRSAVSGEFTIDDEKKSIRFRGRALDLSRTEYRLLKVLVERPGRVFSRDELMRRAWDDPAAAFDRTVDAHVKGLRAKLREVDATVDPIATHRGMGYSLREQA